MRIYGVSISVIGWFYNYLSERKQRAKFGNTITNERPVNTGVPRGTGFGTFLFIVFITDIERALEYSRIKVFAHDMAIYVAGKSKEDKSNKLNVDLANLHVCFSVNKLKVHIKKTTSVPSEDQNCEIKRRGSVSR